MKRIYITLLAVGFALTSLGQSSYPCVIKKDNSWGLSSYNAESEEFAKPSFDLGQNYTRNTFLKFSGQEQYAYASFDGTSSAIHIINNAGGEFKNTRLYERVLSLNHIPTTDQLVYLSTRKVPNYYDFLTEDISITIMDFKGNKAEKIEIPTFSIFVPNLPFIGTHKRTDNRGVEMAMDYSISLPTVDTDKSVFMFVAKDIPGNNRLIKLDLITKKLTTVRVNADVMAMVYVPETKTVKALTIDWDKQEKTIDYYVVDLDPETGAVSNKTLWLETMSSSNPASAPICTMTFDHESNQIVAYSEGVELPSSKSNYITYIETLNNTSTKVVITDVDSDINIPGKKRPVDQVFGFGYDVTVYPNPTNGLLRVATTKDYVVDQLVVTNVHGEVVRKYDVQSGLLMNEIDVSFLSQGMYYVQMTSGGQVHTEKFVKY
jgi:hypothetical protein